VSLLIDRRPHVLFSSTFIILIWNRTLYPFSFSHECFLLRKTFLEVLLVLLCLWETGVSRLEVTLLVLRHFGLERLGKSTWLADRVRSLRGFLSIIELRWWAGTGVEPLLFGLGENIMFFVDLVVDFNSFLLDSLINILFILIAKDLLGFGVGESHKALSAVRRHFSCYYS
jgi:hypothetical protein